MCACDDVRLFIFKNGPSAVLKVHIVNKFRMV